MSVCLNQVRSRCTPGDYIVSTYGTDLQPYGLTRRLAFIMRVVVCLGANDYALLVAATNDAVRDATLARLQHMYPENAEVHDVLRELRNGPRREDAYVCAAEDAGHFGEAFDEDQVDEDQVTTYQGRRFLRINAGARLMRWRTLKVSGCSLIK